MGQRKPFLLRIDAGLWAELEAWAQAELRSVNGQIEYLLKQALQKRKSARLRSATASTASGGAPGQGQSGTGGQPFPALDPLR